MGARPLPLRPDGFGQVLRTPRELRVRRMATADRLPPPRDGRFHGTVDPVTAQVRRRMGETWSPSCPVPLDELRHLTLSFHGLDGAPHTGELVVNASVARGVVGVFRRLWRAGFPLEEMRLVTTADLDAPPTGDGNNTAAYVCRTTRGSSTLSAHAYGLAIDVNPFLNPYRKGDLVLPELAAPTSTGPGTARAWCCAAAWSPGRSRPPAGPGAGTSPRVSDLMHFSANGR